MQRFTRLGAAVVLALGLVVGTAGTAPVAAHGGQIDVELGTDGAGGVSAALVWAGDGHPVEESAVVVVRAASDSGEEVGPIRLVSASEGVGWYRSEPALLGEGHWTVTARVKEPQKAKVRTELDVVAPPAPDTPEPSASSGQDDADDTAGADDPDAAAPGAEGDTAAARTGDGSSSPGVPAWIGWALAALVAAGVVTAVVVRRGRAT
ncbi:hypothetical protein GCM10028784_13650 [Myceligenerans cantabricum]